LLVVAGALAWLSSRGAAGLPSAPIREAVPWVALIAVYFGATIMQNLNIGHRHILPIYPPLFVIAGGVAVLPSRTRKWAGVLVAATLLWLAGDTIAVFPDYLAYFNPLAGGRAHGYQRLVDSSLDWGMDLPTLRIWLDEHNPGEREPVFLSYFGTDSPGYEGLKCKLLPSYYTWARGRSPYALEPGLYAISATMLQCVYLNPFGPWNSASERAYGKSLENLRIFNATSSSPERRRELLSRYSAAFWLHEYDVYDRLRFARLCAWLRHHGAPIGTAGNSILIYKLDAGAIRSAIEGPPPELDDTLLHEVPPAPS
jgi:hypothetical protein